MDVASILGHLKRSATQPAAFPFPRACRFVDDLVQPAAGSELSILPVHSKKQRVRSAKREHPSVWERGLFLVSSGELRFDACFYFAVLCVDDKRGRYKVSDLKPRPTRSTDRRLLGRVSGTG